MNTVSSDNIQLLIALATFLAVLVALFAERFWKWLERPKIKIEFAKNSERCFRWALVQSCNIQDEGVKQNVKKYYFRLKITNNGGTAYKLRVRADIESVDGKEAERFEPSTLGWIDGQQEVTLLKGESEYINFLSQVVDPLDIKNRLTIEIFNTSPRGIAWDRVLKIYKYSITVFGENIEPVLIHAKFVPHTKLDKPGKLIIIK